MKTDIERASLAQSILENPEFQEALKDIEQGIVDRWVSSGVADTEAHTYLKLMLKIHGDYVATLKRRLTDGKIAEIKVERKSKIAGIFRR